ncbi:MAG: hypothetical protein WBS54_05435 [Acidobacteriota bacterium]
MWAEIVLILLLMALVAQASFSPIWDPDSFWHLAIGREIWTVGHPLYKETFSFTLAGKSWFDGEWLFNFGIYVLWRLGGYPLLEWSVALGGALVVGLLYRAVRVTGTTALTLACYFMTVLPAFTDRIRLRPDVLSMMFLALLLERMRRWRTDPDAQPGTWLFVLFLFALWAQCHGGWSFGLLILGVIASGMLLDGWQEGIPFNSHRLAVLVTPLVAALTGVLINPYGWRTLAFPFENLLALFDRQLPVLFEWQHTPLTLSTLPSLAIFSLVFLSTLLPFKKVCWTEVLFSGSQLFLGFWWERYLSFAALTLAPLACLKLEPLLRRGTATRKPILAGALLLLLVRGVSIASMPTSSWSLAENYPLQEVQFLKRHNTPANLFHTFVAGGFLEWEYWPLGRVYMDGRLIFLPELSAYLQAKQSLRTFKAFLLSHPFTVAIVPYASAPLGGQGLDGPARSLNDDIFSNREWALVFFGEYGCVYLRRIPAYEPMIQRYEFHLLKPCDNAYLVWCCRTGKINPAELHSEIERVTKREPKVARALHFSELEQAISAITTKGAIASGRSKASSPTAPPRGPQE